MSPAKQTMMIINDNTYLLTTVKNDMIMLITIHCIIVFICISQQASLTTLMPRLHLTVMLRLHITSCSVGLRYFAASFVAILRSVNTACRFTLPSVDRSSLSVTCDSSQLPIILSVHSRQFRPSVHCLAA